MGGVLLLDREEVQELLGISRTKFYALVREGALPVISVGSEFRVVAADLEKQIRERRPIGSWNKPRRSEPAPVAS